MFLHSSLAQTFETFSGNWTETKKSVPLSKVLIYFLFQPSALGTVNWQLFGVNVNDCIKEKQGSAEKDHAYSAQPCIITVCVIRCDVDSDDI